VVGLDPERHARQERLFEALLADMQERRSVFEVALKCHKYQILVD
jgi:hypothetical protein